MIAEIVLTIFILAFLAYHLSSARRPFYLSVFVWLVTVLGLLTIWVPGFSTSVANHVGIGRGADLVIYLWMAVSLLLFLFVKISLFKLEEQTTLLARKIALQQPEMPPKLLRENGNNQ